MKITLDVKTLIVGIAIGALFTFALGISGTGEADFGFSAPSGGRAVIKSDKQRAYVLDMDTGKAIPVNFVAESKSKVRLDN